MVQKSLMKNWIYTAAFSIVMRKKLSAFYSDAALFLYVYSLLIPFCHCVSLRPSACQFTHWMGSLLSCPLFFLRIHTNLLYP